MKCDETTNCVKVSKASKVSLKCLQSLRWPLKLKKTRLAMFLPVTAAS